MSNRRAVPALVETGERLAPTSTVGQTPEAPSPSDDAVRVGANVALRWERLGRRRGFGRPGNGESSAQKLLREVEPGVHRVESNGEVGDIRPHGLDVPGIPKL